MRLICSGCGKTIPFNGQVCPYCQRDKSKDKQSTVWAVILGLGLGYLGYKLFGVWGAVVSFFIGCVIANVASGYGKSSKPPVVSVVTEKPSTKPSLESEDRLKKLSDLRQKGLIEESEYIAKRKAILDEL
jgi:glutaredoxin